MKHLNQEKIARRTRTVRASLLALCLVVAVVALAAAVPALAEGSDDAEPVVTESAPVPAPVSAPTPATSTSREDVLAELAENGIFPGTVGKDGVWTAYDTGDANTAQIKATVTLPDGSTAPEDSYLYIRKVAEDELYYPTAEALEEAVGGEYNAMQCYAIHWVRICQDAETGEWRYDLQIKSVLGDEDDADPATVVIEYLHPDEYNLAGHQAARKLQVYNSRLSDGSHLEENASPVDVTANADAYTGFTFTTNRGGPYVFVSKKLFEGYVESLTVKNIVDGSGSFDADDEPGNDSSNRNERVRSYDQITYNLIANFGARSNAVTAKNATLCFEATIEADVTEAAFDLAQMLWIENPTIEYLDEAGQVIFTRDADGNLLDSSGAKKTPNDLASGSGEGAGSYASNVRSQRLRGTLPLEADQNLLASNKDLQLGIQVLGADNGVLIQPSVRAWFEGNEDNYGSESSGAGDGVHLAEPVRDNELCPDAVTVSAAPRFNLELAKNANVSYKGWFDSSTGKEVNGENADSYEVGTTTVTGADLYALLEQLAELEENRDKANPESFTDAAHACTYVDGTQLSDYAEAFKNIRYGRITGYGVTLQVYNQASAGQNVSSKGFRGVSLPVGDVTFSLDLASGISGEGAADADPDQYYSQLWEYNENDNEASGNQDRNLYWADLSSTRYAAWAAPYNSGSGESSCYEGGTWTLNDDGTYAFTVSGYDFNFLSSGLSFPTHKAGNSGASEGYDSYIGSFSAGYLQVLNVFPRNQSHTLNLSTRVTVKDLAATTKDGQSIAPSTEDSTGYAHEANAGDNSLSDDIPLYAKGGMTKANAFCDAVTYDVPASDFATKERFLGTDFWGTSYDCSAFAGQRVTLVGAARINAGDYDIRHMNMLQLFDSNVLSLSRSENGDVMKPYVVSRVSGAKVGETTILYAADPDHRQGYDTDDSAVMTYMSTVREEDLIYFESLDELEAAGYVCVGVLAELRDWDIPGEGGYSTALKIALDVSESEEYLTQTVGTVNTVRIWTNEKDMTVPDGTGGTKWVSWADGTNDPAQEKNSVAGYTPVSPNDSMHYSGEVANSPESAYQKTEYEGGQIKFGTNTNGYVYGSSLLVLTYESKVFIGVDNGGGAAQPTFDMDKGNYTVRYRLSGIVAEPGDVIGQAQEKVTNLTVLSKLDTDRKDGGTDQRISVSDGSSVMVPASEHMQLVDEGGNVLAEQSVSIGADPENPTTVRYRIWDDEANNGAGAWVSYQVQVYAQRDTSGSQVTFEIKGATLGVSVPDITYEAVIDPQAVDGNDTIQADAYISGTDDVRAYTKVNGNMDTTTIGISKLGGTRLAKSVEERYIELDGLINYTVTYTNNSPSEPVSLYLYDLMPDTNDVRESEFSGNVIPRAISATLGSAGGSAAAAGTRIDFYYSKTPYDELYKKVSVFGAESGTETTAERRAAIDAMLQDETTFRPLGSIVDGGAFQSSDYLNQMFGNDSAALSAEMAEVTGIYAVVTDLAPSTSLHITVTVETDGNEAADLYRNIANTWLGDGTEPLQSNRVETSVVARAISGVVWDDANLNGVRDEGESPIPGVTCTLFRWDEDEQGYVVCDTDVTGEPVTPVTTDEDGTYAFDRLAPGRYLVAFSGDALGRYGGATTYRVHGADDATSNDAVALLDTESVLDTEVGQIEGFATGDYRYAIAYSLGEDKAVGPTELHTIEDIVGGNLALTNNVELYANLDCGLVVNADYELPETGGDGTTAFYLAGGALAITGTLGAVALWSRRRAA